MVTNPAVIFAQPKRYILPLAAGALLMPLIAVAAPAACVDYYGTDRATPTGFGAAHHILSGAKDMLLKTLSCNDTNALISAGNGSDSTYIYKHGYYWTGTAWNPVPLFGKSSVLGNNWYAGIAYGKVPFLGGNRRLYYLGYTCHKLEAAWKCGCQDSACVKPAWQLQRMDKAKEGMAPRTSLTANPVSISRGGTSTLTWTSAGATICSGTGFPTDDQTEGSVSVSPRTSTTYRLSCSNGTAQATKSVRVGVLYPGGGGGTTGSAATCGNNICEAGETSTSCAQDCSIIVPVCGNNMCEIGETFSCSQDCVGAGANLVSNNAFDSGITSWTSSAPAEFSYDSTLSRTAGGGSLRLTTTDNLASARSIKFAVLPNRFYRVTGYVNSDVQAELRIQQFKNLTQSSLPNYPAWLGTRGDPGWQEISAVFVTSLDAIQAQVYLLLRENGTAAFDDIRVELLPDEAPFALQTGSGVNFAGSPSIMGMRILSSQLSTDGTTFSLDTNAAHFELNASTGLLTGRQTLDGTRDRVSVQLPVPADPMRILTQDEDRVILTTDKFDISFQGDSMVVMALASGGHATVTRPFVGEFDKYQAGYMTSIDDIGGVAIFPGYQRGTGLTNSFVVSEGSGTPPASLTYAFAPGGKLAVAVFPPKPFDWEKSFDDQIIHSDLYPTRAVLEDWSSIANVVILHENIWKGNAPKNYTDYEPDDANELRRVIDDAHGLGLHIAPYLSSDFYREQVGASFITEVQRLRDEYGFDSVYYDGVNAYDWEYSYEIMRQTRDLFPNGRVYLHMSYGTPFRKDNIDIYLPQLESLADYTLSGESVYMYEWTDPHLNYRARGYTLSNTIGTVKEERFTVGGQAPTTEELLNGLLDLNMRQRIVAYPSSGVYPTAASLVPPGGAWANYKARLADMKAQWQAGLLP